MFKKTLLRRILPPVLLAVSGAWLYSNTLDSPFVFDDLPFIQHNTNIKDVTDLKAIWNSTPSPSRFISYLSFALDHRRGGGDVQAFHITNIIIHVLNSWLVFWLMLMTLGTYRFKESEENRNKYLLSFCCALLFLSHPLQTQAVTYITQRFASLTTLFYLLSLCCFIYAKQKRQIAFYVLSAVSALLAMFSKQIAITLPLMIILYDAVFFKRHKGKFPVHWIFIGSFIVVIPCIYSFKIIEILTAQSTSGSYLGEPLNAYNYLLTQFRVVIRYLKLLFVPLGQNLLYEFQASRSFWEPPALLSFAGLFSLFLFSLYAFRKNALVAFGLWWFFLALSVESSVIVIRHVIFEHRVYLPSVGFFMAFTVFLWMIFRNRVVMAGVLSILILACSFLTYQRNKVWQSSISLWTDIVAKSPKLTKAQLNLALAYSEKGRMLEAIKIYNDMIKTAPSAEALGNRANIYYQLGEYDTAISDYKKAIAIKDNSARLLTGRADAYFKKGDIKSALSDYSRAIEVNDQYYSAYSHRANAYRVQKKYPLAQKDYLAALELNPYLAEAYLGMGAVAFMQEQYDKAVDYFSHILTLEEDNVNAYLNRANSYSALNRFDEAAADYERALILEPLNGQIYYNRSILYRKLGQEKNSIEDLAKSKVLGYTP